MRLRLISQNRLNWGPFYLQLLLRNNYGTISHHISIQWNFHGPRWLHCYLEKLWTDPDTKVSYLLLMTADISSVLQITTCFNITVESGENGKPFHAPSVLLRLMVYSACWRKISHYTNSTASNNDISFNQGEKGSTCCYNGLISYFLGPLWIHYNSFLYDHFPNSVL